MLLETSNVNNPKFDNNESVFSILNRAFLSSPVRLITFGIILFLQFMAADIIIKRSGNHYDDSYYGATQKTQDEIDIVVKLAFIKYALLLTLIITSITGHTISRRVFQCVVLFGTFLVWGMVSVMSSSFQQDEDHRTVALKSFRENAVPIYAPVVFSSYKRAETERHKYSYTVAEGISPRTKGYLIIVDLNNLIDSFPALQHLTQNFNNYTKHGFDSTYIPEKKPDIPNCFQFEFDFQKSLKAFPKLPRVGSYVKIKFDPMEEYILMDTDSTTAITPSFDNIPHADSTKTRN